MSIEQTQKPPKKHGIILKVALIVILLIFIAMIGANFVKSYMTNKILSHLPQQAEPVTVETFKPQTWVPEIQTSATIRPNQGAMLQSQASGVVSEVLVKSGQAVKKGEVLVRLDSRVEIAQLNASKAKLASIAQTYHSYVKLYKTQSVSKQELDNAKAAYDSLVASIKSMEAGINRRQIVAPFSGIAGIVKVNVGQFVNVGTDIVRVEDHSQMKVDFGISEKHLDLLHIGQKVLATTDAYPNQTFTATITAIDPAVNASTGLVEVQAVFKNQDKYPLMSGMFVRLSVQVSTEENQFVVPQIAVSYNMYGNFIYILSPISEKEKAALADSQMFAQKNNLENVYRVKQTPITVLDRRSVYAHLAQDNFKFGEKFVVGGMQRLNNNSLVYVENKPLIGVNPPKNPGNL